ncbi:MAG TPA: histidine kinase, partial [Flavisolibacter sp.]|nr:histidine kinase [Flavisolibacter sp.]
MNMAIQQTKQARMGDITRNVILCTALWGLSIPLLILGHADPDGIVGWSIFALFAVFLYGWFFRYLLPSAYTQKKPLRNYVERAILFIAIAWLPLTLLIIALLHSFEHAMEISMANTFFQLFVTVPLLWFLYRRQVKARAEVLELRKELGQSNASIDFLRSQINPHFLFNALNTIYGTAIQESAERTSAAVEKLGDMMRFMLHENMQEKISLSRE